jgi:hypothetical protein
MAGALARGEECDDDVVVGMVEQQYWTTCRRLDRRVIFTHASVWESHGYDPPARAWHPLVWGGAGKEKVTGRPPSGRAAGEKATGAARKWTWLSIIINFFQLVIRKKFCSPTINQQVCHQNQTNF